MGGRNRNDLSAIIFDMDGLMLDSETIYRTAWKRAAADLGYCLDDALYARLVGRRTTECEEVLATTFGLAFPLMAFRDRWASLWQMHVREHGLPFKSGLLELLDQLDVWAVTKAIATSTEHVPALLSLDFAV